MKKVFLVLGLLFILFKCSNHDMKYVYDGEFIPPPDETSTPMLISPENSETLTQNFMFIWTQVTNANKYTVEISYSDSFDSILLSKESENTHVQVSLSEFPNASGSYYWRVIANFGLAEGVPTKAYKLAILKGGILYVSSSSNVSDNGHGSINDPFKRLEDAVTYASLFDGIQKIYVAEGFYTANVFITKDIELYGGFSSTNWSIRDKDTYKTIITPLYANSIVIGSDITRSTIIEGFYFDNYLSTYTISLLISMSASPTVQNNIFYNSRTFNNIEYYYYYAYSTSPGILVSNNSNPLIQLCQFTKPLTGSAYMIPSLNSISGEPDIINCTFSGQISINGGSPNIISNYCRYIDMKNLKENESIQFQGNTINNININYNGYGKINIHNNIINNNANQCLGIYLNYPSNLSPTTNNNMILIGGNYFSLTGTYYSEAIVSIHSNELMSGISDIYIYNNTLNFYCDISNTNSTYFISESYNYSNPSNPANTYYYNNVFVLTGSSISSVRAFDCRYAPIIKAYNNLFVGTKIINDTFYVYTGSGSISGSIADLNTICGSDSNLYDYDYTNVFNNIDASFSPYVLKSTATNAIDKGYNYSMHGTNILDILTTDITMTHSRISGGAIDIGAFEY